MYVYANPVLFLIVNIYVPIYYFWFISSTGCLPPINFNKGLVTISSKLLEQRLLDVEFT